MSQPPFDFNIETKPSTSSRRRGSRQRFGLCEQTAFIGAWVCLLYSPLSPNWLARFTIGNALINLISVVPLALIPLAVLWRLRNKTPLSLTQRYVGCSVVGLTVVFTIAIWFGTGILSSMNWHTWWCSFLGRCAIAAVILWFPSFSLKNSMPLFVVGGVAVLMLISFTLRAWELTRPTVMWSGYAGFKNLLILISLLEKLLILTVVACFVASRWGHSPVAASGSLNQPHSPSRFKTFLSSLSASTTAATQLVARQTEHTKLTTLTLPAAYRALGKDCVQQKRHLHCVPELMEQLRSVMGELKTLTDSAKAQPTPQSITDKAKAAGRQAADLARQKQLGMKRDSLLAEIGRAIHDIHGEGSGVAEVVVPVREALDRLAVLDADISRLSEVGRGSLLTPKRLLIGGGATAVLLVSVVVYVAGAWMFGGKNADTKGSADRGRGTSSQNGGKGFAQKVLDADPNLFTGSNVRSHKNVVKDFTPKHPAGTKADAIQAIAMLTPGMTTNNPPNFIRHNEGTSAFFGLRCNPALWNAVFGSPQSVRTNVHNKHEWIIRCSDGDLRCVGDILGNRYFGVDVVFKE